MQIVSWNVNGLRGVYKKGFLDWVKIEKPDILCLQEIKANEDQLELDEKFIKGYYCYYNSAKKKGYSGVAIFTKQKPDLVKNILGHTRFDEEGRMLHLKYSLFDLIAIYIPHGNRQKIDLEYKIEVYNHLFNYIVKLKRKQKNIIIAGDFNIAHTENDLARPKDNKNNIMFTFEERALLDKLLSYGFSDAFREFYQGNGFYTWWPYFANARERNLGWRIDYMFVSNAMLFTLQDANILKNIYGSDHCPIRISLL